MDKVTKRAHGFDRDGCLPWRMTLCTGGKVVNFEASHFILDRRSTGSQDASLVSFPIGNDDGNVVDVGTELEEFIRDLIQIEELKNIAQILQTAPRIRRF